MSFENFYRYTTESIILCYDVLDFYKKKKDIELQYSKSLCKFIIINILDKVDLLIFYNINNICF